MDALLGDDLLAYVLSFLDTRTRLTVAGLVCRRWLAVVRSPPLSLSLWWAPRDESAAPLAAAAALADRVEFAVPGSDGRRQEGGNGLDRSLDHGGGLVEIDLRRGARLETASLTVANPAISPFSFVTSVSIVTYVDTIASCVARGVGIGVIFRK